MRRLRIVALVLVVATGCASQTDLQQIRREQRSMRNQLADTRAAVEGMQRDLAVMRGKIDEARYSGRRRAEEGDLESVKARLAAIEQGKSPAITPADATALPAPAEPSPTPAPGALAASDLSREESQQVPEDYRRALALVRQNEYDRAVQRLREFLRTNPETPLAANAHYWIGECYFQLGDYSQAILQFNDVRQQYPRSDRVAPSLLKIGLAFLQMGNKSEARLAFQKVVNDFPSSPEAAQAREKLRTLGV